MSKKFLNVNFINELMERKNNLEIGEEVEFLYKSDNENVWNLTLKREEDQYYPFIFALEGNKIGTNETWGRRYTSMEQAILHIVNNFNENVSIKDKYSNLEEYILEAEERENPRKFDYMMLDRLKTDCDYFLGNGNGFLGHLYYKDIDRHIEEMEKIYESFSNEEKPEWINLENIKNYKEKMTKMLEKSEEEEI